MNHWVDRLEEWLVDEFGRISEMWSNLDVIQKLLLKLSGVLLFSLFYGLFATLRVHWTLGILCGMLIFIFGYAMSLEQFLNASGIDIRPTLKVLKERSSAFYWRHWWMANLLAEFLFLPVLIFAINSAASWLGFPLVTFWVMMWRLSVVLWNFYVYTQEGMAEIQRREQESNDRFNNRLLWFETKMKYISVWLTAFFKSVWEDLTFISRVRK